MLAGVELELSRGGIQVDPISMRTSHPRIWAGGDVAHGPRNLIDAIADGQRAAAAIHAELAGLVAAPPGGVHVELHRRPTFRRLSTSYDAIERQPVPATPSARRIGFAEVEVGYDADDAWLQSLRCLRCFDNVMLEPSLCILCGLCVDVCPTNCITIARADAIGLGEASQSVLLLDEDLCIRCGLCVNRCPPARSRWCTHGSSSVAEPTTEEPVARDPLEPKTAFAPGGGLGARIKRSNVWRSMFRHPTLDTPRGRALQSFSNFFLHLYPVKVPGPGAAHPLLVPARLHRHGAVRHPGRHRRLPHVLLHAGGGLGVRRHAAPAHRRRLRAAGPQRAPVVGAPDGARRRAAPGPDVLRRGLQAPREFNWVLGVALLVLTLALSFTGYLLPWDQLSYWAVTVGTNLVQYVPLLGGWLQDLLIGGDQIGQPTLLRFYALHVAVLPVAVVLVLCVHIWRVRKDGFAVERAVARDVRGRGDRRAGHRSCR